MKKLNTKILLILVPIIIVSLLASSMIIYQVSKEKIETKILSTHEKESKLLANETGLWLGRFYTLIDMSARTDYKTTMTDDERLGLMAEMMKIDSAVTDIYLGKTNGVMIDGSGWEPPAEYDPRVRPWYQSALDIGKTAFSDPYVDMVTNAVVTSVSSPVNDKNGQLMGVIAADVQLNDVTDRINKVKIGEDGYAAIVTDRGVYIAHPDPNVISKNGFTDFDDNIKSLTTAVTSTETGTYEYTYEGVEKVATYATIPNTNWKLMVLVSKDSLTKELDSLLVIILISTIVFLLITVIVISIITRRITKPLELLSDATNKLSKGDLTQKAIVKDSTEIGRLSNSFNMMADNLRSLVKGITHLTGDVHTVSNEMNRSSEKTEEIAIQISQAITELAKGAEQQSESVNTSAMKITSMTHSFDDIVNSIQLVYSMTEKIDELVETGEEAIEIQNKSMLENTKATDSVNEAIHMLDVKTREIEQVVSVIDSLASQTNLLALNASIEAARAGEHGRGFSVVADEIRKLAEQSSQSTGRIGESINEIVQRTRSAVDQAVIAEEAVKLQEKSVSEVADIFKKVKDSVVEMKANFDEVKDKNEQIRDEATTIQGAIREISDVIEMNSASAEEVAASTEQQVSTLQTVTRLSAEVEALADKLKGEVDKFKV